MKAMTPLRLRRFRDGMVSGHRVTLLRDGREAFPAMLRAIEQARRQVLLEMYWFDSDRTGRRFAMALVGAARRGVEVAVIYDAFGSVEADPEMFAMLRRAGVHVLEFNPITPWRKRFNLERLTLRDHRKILVVDGREGFTGGVNLADQWAPAEDGGGGWRDDMVRITGPAVAGLSACFFRTWNRPGMPPLLRGGVPLEEVDELSKERPVRVLGEAYTRKRREIVRAYLYRIHTAKERVWITNSYFVPDGVIRRALKRAARRGADVRVLLPGRSDVPIVRIASHAIYEQLLQAGVRIFEWDRSILHSKTAVIDGHWSTIGTFNLDYRSLRSNLEVNVAIEDGEFGALMERSFQADLGLSREVDLSSFEQRPLPTRMLESVVYRFRKLL